MGRRHVLDENKTDAVLVALRAGLSESLDDLGKETVEKIEEGFDRGTDALGRQWEPLAPSTIQQKGHATVLVEEGDLRESFDYDVQSSTLTLEIYSDDPKARYHEFGTERMPKRPILQPAFKWAQTQGLGTVETTINDKLDGALGVSGGLM